MKHASWFVALFMVAICAAASYAQTPVDSLKKLIDDEWAWRLRENPLFATSVGDHSADDRLPSVAVADYERREKDAREFLKRWTAIDGATLTGADRVNYDFFGRVLPAGVPGAES